MVSDLYYLAGVLFGVLIMCAILAFSTYFSYKGVSYILKEIKSKWKKK